MEYWLSMLEINENDVDALFWLANNNDKHQKEYIKRGLEIDPNHILLKACSLRYTSKYLDDILNNLNNDIEYIGYVYYQLGSYYQYLQNDECEMYFKLAIEHGYLFAYIDLHICFNMNIDEYKRDIQLFIIENELNTSIFEYLGFYYSMIEKDNERMMNNYLTSIEQGNSNSMLLLGNYYESIKNYPEMIHYYVMSIENGNHFAMNKLGEYYYSIQNYSEMLKYYTLAIENEDTLAMNNLGMYYLQVENYPEMLKYFQFAIDKGNTLAMNNLGMYYLQVEQNYPEMLKYFQLAIDKGNTLAMNNLGMYYLQVEQNYSEMLKYLQLAVEKGDTLATENVMTIYNLIKENK
jgi:TPR repeat protein